MYYKAGRIFQFKSLQLYRSALTTPITNYESPSDLSLQNLSEVDAYIRCDHLEFFFAQIKKPKVLDSKSGVIYELEMPFFNISSNSSQQLMSDVVIHGEMLYYIGYYSKNQKHMLMAYDLAEAETSGFKSKPSFATSTNTRCFSIRESDGAIASLFDDGKLHALGNSIDFALLYNTHHTAWTVQWDAESLLVGLSNASQKPHKRNYLVLLDDGMRVLDSLTFSEACKFF